MYYTKSLQKKKKDISVVELSTLETKILFVQISMPILAILEANTVIFVCVCDCKRKSC